MPTRKGFACFLYPWLVLFCILNPLLVSNLKAQYRIDSLKQIILKGGLEQGKLSLVYANLSREYNLINNDSCLFTGKTGLLLAEKTGNKHGIISNSVQIALYLLSNDSLKSAKSYFLKAYSLTTSHSDALNRMRTTNGLGYISELQSDFVGAMDYYLQGKRIAEESGYIEWKADFINNIAVVYSSAGIYGKSVELHQQSLQIYGNQHDSINYANTLVNIGAAFLGLNNVDSARYFYFRALPIQKRLKNYYGLANLYLGLASIKLAGTDYSGALQMVNVTRGLIDSVDKSFRGGTLFIQVGVDLKTAIICQKLKEYPKAESMYRSARLYAQKGAFLQEETKTLKGLTEVFILQGKTDSALSYSELHNKYSESLLTIRNEQRIAFTVLEFNNKIEKEQQVLYEEIMKSAQVRDRLAFVLISSLIFTMTIVLLLLFLLQRSKSKHLSLLEANARLENDNLQMEKIGLEKNIAFKNNEVMSKTMSLAEKNEQMVDMSNRLKGLVKNNKTQEEGIFHLLLHDIQIHNSDSFWNEFNARFLEIHPDFNNRLVRDFPGLTPNDIRLCAFIKLNLSTKETAQITHKTEHSIKISRYRLRKKLNLTNKENLTMFLQKI